MKITVALFLTTFLGSQFQINIFRGMESTAKTNLDFSRKIDTVGTANSNGAVTLITVDRKKCFEGNMFHVSIIHISFSLFNVKKIR